jgi:site-specific DNA recombinase
VGSISTNDRNAVKAAGYIRVSTAEQAEEGLSLGEQERRIRAHADAQGWNVTAVYADRGLKGGIPLAERPAGAEALAAAQGLDRLVVLKLDRLGRSAPDLLSVIGHFTACGCHVVSVSEAIDTSTATGRLLRTVLAGVAEFERDRIGERVRDIDRARAAAGRPHGGLRAYGYRYAEDGSGLVIVQAEAVVVRRIFAEYVAGRSQLAITRDLIRDGVPTARGGRWHQGTVRSMLANPIHAGLIEHEGETFPGEHEAIIDLTTWERAKALRATKARTHGPGRPPAGRHLFRRGMLRCECGAAMVPRTQRNRRSDPYEIYLCYGHHRDPASCTMPPVRRVQIDSAVYRYFEQVGLDVDATRSQLAASRDQKLAEVTVLLTEAERQAQQASERLARVRGHYQDGKIDPDDWAEQRAQLGAERQAAEAEVERLRFQQREVEQWGELRDVEAETLHRLSEIRAAIAGEIQDAAGVEAVRAALAGSSSVS